MFNKLNKYSKQIGIDGAVAFTILTRVVQGGGGVISIVFITRFLSADEQGYYYTFASILAIQIFFELGLTGIITQYTAHEFAYLNLIDGVGLIGEEYYKSRLSSLLHFCVKWFAIISFFLFFILYITGYYFFSRYDHNLNIEWHMPWVILCASTSLNLFIDPILAYFDGLGKVKDMAKVRLIQKVVNVILLFVFFLCGFKLYSSALASIIAILINYFQIIFSKRINLLKIIWANKTQWVVNYMGEIFPFQWRIAVSWVSGYFIFQLFNPVLFATEGAAIAGKMGVTIAALTGISSISMSWINTKVPLFSTLIAKREFIELDESFKKTSIQSIAVNILCVCCFFLFIKSASLLDMKIASRFLDFLPFLFMCLANLLIQMVFALATYLRCHKKEPMLLQSITMGVLTCVSTIIFGGKFGVMGISSSFFVLNVISFIWTVFIFLRKRRDWHSG